MHKKLLAEFRMMKTRSLTASKYREEIFKGIERITELKNNSVITTAEYETLYLQYMHELFMVDNSRSEADVGR